MKKQSSNKNKQAFNNTIEKIKQFNYKKAYKKVKKNIKGILLYNRQFVAYVILALISCILVRVFTIGTKFEFWPMFFDLSVIILFGSLSFLVKPKKRYIPLQIILIIITIMNIINAVYYAFYDFASFSLLSSLGQASDVTGAIFEQLKIHHFIYLIMPIAFWYINKTLKEKDYFNVVEKYDGGKRMFLEVLIIGGICLFINISSLTGTDISRLTKQWNREYIVKRFGIVVYQGNDLFQTIRSKLSSIFGYEEAESNFITYYTENPYQQDKNKYTNLFEGYNVVTIHMESIMTFLIDLKVNGVEVTPNLNRLTKESMYFDNFYAQISSGTSSDTEFTYSSSLLPVQLGTVNVSYYNRSYQTLQSLLKEKNYYTFSMHGNKASMWNRNRMHPSLGYEEFYSSEFYKIDEIVGLGLSDKSFFTQSESILNDIDEMVKDKDNDYKNWMGTIITLSNHTPFDINNYIDETELFDVTYHTGKKDENGEEIIFEYLEGTTIGNYLKSAHYADECLGEFIDYVKGNDMFKKTLFVMYGDHAAQLSKNQFKTFINYDFETGKQMEKEDENYVDYDYYENELFKKTPLVIWTPNETKNEKLKGKFSYPMGMIDVLPTISNMLNITPKYALGHDIFMTKNNNVIIFPNGNFLSKKVYYYNSKNEYKMLDKNGILEDDYIEKNKKHAEEMLRLSNDIIVYDLIAKAGEKVGEKDNE